jgi:hypothetical protein
MTRGRLCVVCGFRLATYAVAMLLVRHAAEPAMTSRLMLAEDGSAFDFTGLLLAVLLVGILLECLSGAARWR